jgi:acetyl esterase/lipase
MLSFLWPQEFSFLQYIRLKAMAVMYRSLVVIRDPFMMRCERRLIPANVRQKRIKIASRDSLRTIPGDMYYPPGYSSSPLPVLVVWHGSGFVIPGLGLDALFCSRLARDAGVVVLDADYRKAPENPFPAALHDVEDVLKWIATQDGLDAKRVAVGGFSAGANLALVAATTLRKKLSYLINIPLVISIYPETDLSVPAAAKFSHDPAKAIPTNILAFFNDSYCPDERVRKNPLVSPSFAEPADFPAMTSIITGEGDSLRAEAEALANKLEKDGRDIFYHMVKEGAHGFDKRAKEGTIQWTQREELISVSVKLLKERI